MMTTIPARVTSLKDSQREHTYILFKPECMQCLFPEQHLDIKLQKS